MLIRSLHAENFMKFERLRLENLPSEGVIGIEGPNESGKSTIAEAILFAFFGRSRQGKDGPVEHLIRWGADALRVEVEFIMTETAEGLAEEPGAGDGYLISREIDRFGTNYVKLLSLPERRELATGHLQVLDFIRRRIKFDSLEFQRSFYFNQFDETAGNASFSSLLDLVERITGISHMDRASDCIGKGIEQLEREFSHYQRDIQRYLRQLERHAHGAERVSELEGRRAKAAEEYENLKSRVGERTAALAARRKRLEERTACERSLEELASSSDAIIASKLPEITERYERLGSMADRGEREDRGDELRRAVDGLKEVGGLFAGARELLRALEREQESVEAESVRKRAEELRATRDRTAAELEETSRRAPPAWRWSVAAAVSIMALVAAGGALALQPGWRPDAATGESRTLPGAALAAVVGLAAAALVAGVFAVQRYRRLRRRARDLRVTLDELDTEIAAAEEQADRRAQLVEARERGALRDVIAFAKTLAAPLLAERFNEFASLQSRLLDPGSGEKSGYNDSLRAIAHAERQTCEKISGSIQTEARKLKELESRLKKTRSERDRLENEVRECRSQSAKKEVLEEKVHELETSAQRIRGEIDDRRCACKLLEDTAATVRMKLAPTLAALLRKMLPHLTGGRYRDVKISEGFDVHVFAREKSDFLSADELSGGTVEALLVALRLAFSQAFVAARSRRPQFVLLDEPFKMMDVGRALGALEVLRSLSPDLTQFFIIQPNYTGEQRKVFDRLITTTVDTSRLEAGV